MDLSYQEIILMIRHIIIDVRPLLALQSIIDYYMVASSLLLVVAVVLFAI